MLSLNESPCVFPISKGNGCVNNPIIGGHNWEKASNSNISQDLLIWMGTTSICKSGNPQLSKRIRISILQNFCSDSTFLEHPKHSSNAKHSHICIIGIIAFLFRQLSLYMRESERHSVVVPRTSSPENRLDDDTQQTLSYSFYVVTA